MTETNQGAPAASATDAGKADAASTAGAAILREIVETMALFAVIFTIARMTIGNYAIIGRSMEPNYHEAERLLVDRIAPRMHWLERGDVVIVKSPSEEGVELIKRLIGLPGDTVELRGGRVVVNGYALEEPYLPPGADSGPRSGSSAWVLGPDQYFIMGDNRSFSQDSRMLGPVGSELIVGRALVVYWPFENRSIVQHAEYGIK
jgi:signal peptidase I